MASVHGGVRPVCRQGSRVTTRVPPRAFGPAAASAVTSACGPPAGAVAPSPTRHRPGRGRRHRRAGWGWWCRARSRRARRRGASLRRGCPAGPRCARARASLRVGSHEAGNCAGRHPAAARRRCHARADNRADAAARCLPSGLSPSALEFHQVNRAPADGSTGLRVADYNRRLGIAPTPERANCFRYAPAVSHAHLFPLCRLVTFDGGRRRVGAARWPVDRVTARTGASGSGPVPGLAGSRHGRARGDLGIRAGARRW